MLKVEKVLMPISAQKTSKHILKGQRGFSLIEIMVALLLAALVFIAVPSGDSTERHRNLKTAIDNIDRAVNFASNESVLRNTVVRLKISLEKLPIEYSVEYGPAGNIPLPEIEEKKSKSLADDKAQEDKKADLNRQFNKVEEFDDIKFEIDEDVSIVGIGTNGQSQILKKGDAYVYFYPTGEKDAAIIFFATNEEIAYLEVSPFLAETKSYFEPIKTSGVAKLEDLIQTRMDEVFKEWIKP